VLHLPYGNKWLGLEVRAGTTIFVNYFTFLDGLFNMKGHIMIQVQRWIYSFQAETIERVAALDLLNCLHGTSSYKVMFIGSQDYAHFVHFHRLS
jgi:hypothetical protein